MLRFSIHTNWTNSIGKTYESASTINLADAAMRDRLKWAFSDPKRRRPGETRQSEQAAQSSATTSDLAVVASPRMNGLGPASADRRRAITDARRGARRPGADDGARRPGLRQRRPSHRGAGHHPVGPSDPARAAGYAETVTPETLPGEIHRERPPSASAARCAARPRGDANGAMSMIPHPDAGRQSGTG